MVLSGVGKTFGGRPALSGIEAVVSKGMITGVAGPDDAGKKEVGEGHEPELLHAGQGVDVPVLAGDGRADVRPGVEQCGDKQAVVHEELVEGRQFTILLIILNIVSFRHLKLIPL